MDFRINTRGFRNNNPGNIRHGSKWKGLKEVQDDKSFCSFVSVEFGIRAIFKLLDTYSTKYDLNTIENIISRYAPPSENATSNYINTVYRYMFDNANPLDAALLNKNKAQTNIHTKTLKTLFVAGIILVEIGFQPFNFEFIEDCEKL
jgi:hypothetical protein